MSGSERLRAVLAAVAPKLEEIAVDGLDPRHTPLLEVTAALVRGVYQQAQSLFVLGEAQSVHGMAAVERAAWEMWNELDYLLRSDDPPAAAVKVQANAVLDVIGLLEKLDNTPPGVLEQNCELRDRLEAEHPGEFQEVRAQRKKNKFHWSGLSRTAICSATIRPAA